MRKQGAPGGTPAEARLLNEKELSVAMLRSDCNARDMARAIGKSRVSFDGKHHRGVPFTPEEIVSIAGVLALDLEQVNHIFFASKLPSCKSATISTV